MRRKINFIIIIFALIIIPCGYDNQKNEVTLTGWGVPGKNIEKFVADANEIGFDALITYSNDPDLIRKTIDAGSKNNIKIFSCISPMNEFRNLWNTRYIDKPLPWQIMSDDEEAARKFLMAGRNQYIVPFQFGGEPKMTNEVLINRIACFNNKDYRELLEQLIDKIASLEGLEGIAFDGFGYENYHSCNCETCKNLLMEYKAKNSGLSDDEAEVTFFRNTLVEYINHLSDHTRKKNKDITTCIHIWPVFSPDPVYGNRLDLDQCGQTAAWYTLWPRDKIARYSRIITEEAKEYFPRQEGVCMIGYYDRPGSFPEKDAARVEMELRTMIENGCTHIQVCGTNDVISKPEIAEIFKKYFK